MKMLLKTFKSKLLQELSAVYDEKEIERNLSFRKEWIPKSLANNHLY